MKLLLLLLLASWPVLPQQNLALTAPAPVPVGSVSARASTSGLGTYCYFVAAVYPIGKAYPTGPACVQNAAGTVTVTWSPAAGATSYDVLRTTAPTLPSGASSILVAAAVVGTTQADTLGALSSYTVAAAPPATANIALDNLNFAQPRLLIDTGVSNLKAWTVTFGDGTTQTTASAGGLPAQQFTATGQGSVAEDAIYKCTITINPASASYWPQSGTTTTETMDFCIIPAGILLTSAVINVATGPAGTGTLTLSVGRNGTWNDILADVDVKLISGTVIPELPSTPTLAGYIMSVRNTCASNCVTAGVSQFTGSIAVTVGGIRVP